MAKKKIMVVDDSRPIVKAVEMILKLENFEVTPAYSGEECLEKYEKEKPDLVLLDITMPGMDGWHVYKKIKEINKDQKVTFLTVRKAPTETMEAMFGGGGDYITKPFDNKDLVRRVKRILG